MKMKWCKRLSTVTLQLFTLTALSWQVISMSMLYFRFKVVTEIDIKIPERVVTSTINLCTRFTDVLDFDAINRDLNRSWFYSLNQEHVYEYQDALTIGQIFTYSPDVMEVIDKITYRDGKTFAAITAVGADVHKIIAVSKYLNMDHVCYRFIMRKRYKKSYDFFTSSMQAHGLIYEIRTNASSLIHRSNYVKIVITMPSAASYPFRSIRFGEIIHLDYNESSQESRYNHLTVYKILVDNQMLPAPYESNCFDYRPIGYYSDADCEHHCMSDKTLAAWNKVPFSAVVNVSSERQLVSYNNLKDPLVMKQLMNMHADCSGRLCKRHGCNTGQALAVTRKESRCGSALTVRLIVPLQPWIYLNNSPALDLIQYITYVMGIMSTYTGVGVLFFNPAAVTKSLDRVIRSRVSLAMLSPDGASPRVRRWQ